MSERTLPLVERISRVLAGAELSANADGDNSHAGKAVDESWRDHRNQALAILHAIREPDPSMTDPAERTAWERTIGAALDRE